VSQLLEITPELQKSCSATSPEAESMRLRGPSKKSLWLILLVFVVYFSLAWFKFGSSEVGIDEGRFGISGINILSDHHQLATVSEDPLGQPGTKPFGYPVLLAASLWALGKTEFALRTVNVIVLAVAALLLYGFVVLVQSDRTPALLTFALFLLNPGSLTYARTAMPEPLVVAAGCLALFCAAKFFTKKSLPWAAACGLALGVGFLSKMWLVLAFVLACFSVLALKLVAERKRVFLVGILLAFLSFLFVAASHLLLVLWLTPSAWSHWMGIYFLFSFGSRVAGTGYDPVMWYRPWWFYLAAVFKASFFGLPLLILGVQAVRKRVNVPLLAVLLSLVLPVFAFSLFQVKQASYIYPTYPALALLLALGWLYLVRDASRVELFFASLFSTGATAFFFAKSVFAWRECAALLAMNLLYFTTVLVGARSNPLVRYGVGAAVFSALLFADALVVKQSIQPPAYYREIAEYFKPQLLSRKPQDVAFTAPAFPAMEFYTFRSGEYWETFYVKKSAVEEAGDLRHGARVFYVVDPSQTVYGGKMSPDRLEALREYGSDVTEDIEKKLGHAIPLRVFVPRAVQPGYVENEGRP
jgi:4-amino-4-deoxy-L-arabinose transferase-like glycosyltransferase